MGTRTTTRPQDEIREKAIRLFTYLRELVRMRWKVVASLEDYEQVLWLDDIPREPECYSAAWSDSQEDQPDVWLRIDKPRVKPPPEVLVKVRPWLNSSQLADSSLTLPELQQQITERVPLESDNSGREQWETVVRNLSDFPGIQKVWDSYVEQNWWP